LAKLLFRLHNVPDDEANDVRALLDEHQLPCYETQEGRWRVGLAAIWIEDNDQYEQARALIDTYQTERYQRIRQEATLSFWENNRQHPIRFFAALLAMVFILSLSLIPFIKFSTPQ